MRTLLARLRADDVPIVEEHEKSTYVAFKCLGPGGHRVEVLLSQTAEPVRVGHGGERLRVVVGQSHGAVALGAGALEDPATRSACSAYFGPVV